MDIEKNGRIRYHFAYIVRIQTLSARKTCRKRVKSEEIINFANKFAERASALPSVL